VHYTAWAAATGEEVDNTRDAREPAQIIVSKGASALRKLAAGSAALTRALPFRAPAALCLDVAHRAGLGAALLRMRPGERALVRVGGARAYGDAGNFSFPAVAPNAELLYDAQLIAVERAATSAEATEVRCRADMLWEERMEAAARYRDTGNAAFRGGEAQGALDAYFAGMSFIDDGMMAQLMGSYLDESSALKAALHSNAAAAALSLGRADEALAQAGAALALAPRNAKALYRKGRAHAALGQDDAARAALLRAQEVDPQDAAIRAALRDLDRRVIACLQGRSKRLPLGVFLQRIQASC
jgi:tetratricopeptide (TPR) repeat protein